MKTKYLAIIAFVIGMLIGVAVLAVYLLWDKSPEEDKPLPDKPPISQTDTYFDESEVYVGDPEDNQFGFLSGAPGDTDIIIAAGAAWARPHLGYFLWDITADTVYGKLGIDRLILLKINSGQAENGLISHRFLDITFNDGCNGTPCTLMHTVGKFEISYSERAL